MAKKKIKKARKEKGRITAKMTFAEIMQKYPGVVGIFLKHGMSCIGCPMAMQETIEQGAAVHGIDIKKLLAELNKAIKKSEKCLGIAKK